METSNDTEFEVDYRICCWMSALAAACYRSWTRDYWYKLAVKGARRGGRCAAS